MGKPTRNMKKKNNQDQANQDEAVTATKCFRFKLDNIGWGFKNGSDVVTMEKGTQKRVPDICLI